MFFILVVHQRLEAARHVDRTIDPGINAELRLALESFRMVPFQISVSINMTIFLKLHLDLDPEKYRSRY